jgi:tetratricopeptide (TPR) repeat protein
MARVASIGPYELREQIGQGGMGVVLKAWDPGLQREVAIKLLRSDLDPKDPNFRRFLREQRVCAQLLHPHILPIHTGGLHEKTPYLVLELVPGPSLQERIGRSGPLSVEAALRICRKLASALGHAHKAEIVHRDVKPSNVLFSELGEPLLTDFGLAKSTRTDRTQLSEAGSILGSPGYWAPEQALGRDEEVGPETDIYSLGATLYFCLTGRPPFIGGNLVQSIVATCTHEPEPLSSARDDVPPEVDAICRRALKKAPAERFQSAKQLEQALADALDPEPKRATQTPPAGVLVATLVGLLLTGVWLLTRVIESQRGDPAATAQLESVLSELRAPRGELALERSQIAALRSQLDALASGFAAEGAPVLRARCLLALNRHADAVAALESAGPEPFGASQVEAEARAARWLLHQALAGRTAVPGPLRTALGRPRRAGEELSARARIASASTGGPALTSEHPSALALSGAFAAWQAGEAAQAASLLDRALKLRPRSLSALALRARVRHAAGDHAGELEDGVLAYMLQPHSALLLAWQGFARACLADWGAARADAEASLRLQPTAHGNGVLAWTRRKTHDPAGALSSATAAINLDPHSELATYERGAALEALGRYAEALVEVEALLRKHPRSAKGFRLRGNLRANRKEHDKAIADYTESLRIDPRDEMTYYNRAHSHYLLGAFDRSLKDAAQGTRLNPREFANYHLRALVFLDKLEPSRPAKAEKELNRGLELVEDRVGRSQLLRLRGQLFRNLGRGREALRDWEESLRLDPEQPALSKALSGLRAQRGLR